MPAYRNLLSTVEDLDKFLNFPNISTKAVLYTQKNSTTSLYKALSAEFRGRIKFGEVVPPHDSALIEREQIDKFPSLVVYQKTIDGDEIH
jgi:protein disulfide-isomerase A6